jgi:hypothetical protein
VVNKIDWDKAGRITEPGRYLLSFGWLTVTADDVAVWRHYPGASFTLIEVASLFDGLETSEYHLGTFDLPRAAQSSIPCSASGGVAS